LATTTDRRIAVVMGGLSAEREVSLNTGRGVLRALLERGRDAVGIEWSDGQDLGALLRDARAAVVWNALHGTYGEDGCVQGLLECLKIPYTGSGVLASALAMDKVLSKRLFDAARIPTPRWAVLGAIDPSPRRLGGGWALPCGSDDFSFPLVIKPSREGSTVGVTIVKEPDGVAPAIAEARRCHGEVMVEEYIAGREASVAILDEEVLGSVEIRPRREFYDYEAKYQSGDTEYLVPPTYPADVSAACEDAARRAYLALACRGHARVDARIDAGGRPFILEVNTLPGMTGTSLLPKIAAHRGMDYATLVERILASAGLRE
jgi:D-alanine-D-alanine ligase